MLKSKTEEAASTAEATKTAIEGFEGELEKKAEQTVDEGLQKVRLFSNWFDEIKFGRSIRWLLLYYITF